MYFVAYCRLFGSEKLCTRSLEFREGNKAKFIGARSGLNGVRARGGGVARAQNISPSIVKPLISFVNHCPTYGYMFL